ncbi:MAG: NAD(P)/FAD-dependent oxidoreductase [Vicinamibacterales bacterium]
MNTPHERPALTVIGAGPAGLTGAYYARRFGATALVLDQDTRVGGLAQTGTHRGFRFDIGGHRFFTRMPGIARLWRSMLGADFRATNRLSRIYYNRHFFSYPLEPLPALRTLGYRESAHIVSSYVAARLNPRRPERTFDAWVINRFGERLFRTFFEAYTEKVWGIPCTHISAAWAAQRIKNMSLRSAVTKAILPGSAGPTSLITQFEYPRHGPGMMWEAFARAIEADGGRVRLGCRMTRVDHDGARVHAVHVAAGGETERLPVERLLSTVPLQHLVRAMTPAAPDHVLAAAAGLRYRAFLTVVVLVEARSLFPDNWLYIHEPSLRVARIQNYKNWSADMVPDDRYTCLGLEYFCDEGDALWSRPDASLLQLAGEELTALGLVPAGGVMNGTVVRMPHAYPVYDDAYVGHLAVIRSYLDTFDNLETAGRAGLHKYNNQDHSMLTAVLATRRLFGLRGDPWSVNADEEYHEEGDAQFVDLLTGLEHLEETQPPALDVVGAGTSSRGDA